MFKKVIWATDGSEAADRALPLVKWFVADVGAQLLVVHCTELSMPRKAGGTLPVHANEDELTRKIERQVADLSRDGAVTSLRSARTMVGGAGHAIAEIAKEEGSDLIVVGNRGHTALAGLLLGSVTQRLLHIAPCPVLTVPTATAAGHGASS